MSEERQKIRILSEKDLSISYFCGSGAGGQARNKVASGVMMVHEESGATGRASDSRSQHQNKISAWQRLMRDSRMKFWITKKVFEVQQGETLEKSVERDMVRSNLKIEVKDESGKWVEAKD